VFFFGQIYHLKKYPTKNNNKNKLIK
jgi:hypothetical protein